MLRMDVIGVLKSMKTIMMEKIWRLLPVMYMPNSKVRVMRFYELAK